MIMKQNVFIAAALICMAACTTSVQTKPDYSEAILGCWELYDVHYDIKTNYPEIDSIVKKILYERLEESKKAALVSKFFRDKTSRVYDRNGSMKGHVDIYNLTGDSLSIQSTVRSDAKSTSKIMISNDTLYYELRIERTFYYTLMDLRWDSRKKGGVLFQKDIPEEEDVKFERITRYATCVRVKDCDQYKE